MPIYEYQCPKCEKIHEVIQKFSDDPMKTCPTCDGPVTKLMSKSSFALKGDGWYASGYNKKPPSAAKSDGDKSGGAEKGGSEKSGGDKSDSSKSGGDKSSSSGSDSSKSSGDKKSASEKSSSSKKSTGSEKNSGKSSK